MYLIPRGGVGAYFVGKIGGTVHEPVGIVGQIKPVLRGVVEPAVDLAEGK